MAAEQGIRSVPPFTAKLIEALEPGTRDREFFDTAAPGLCLRVTAGGAKVFRWKAGAAGKRRNVTLGPWAKVSKPGHLTLAEARTWLERLKAGHRAGRLDQVEAELEAQLRPPPAPTAAPEAAGPKLREVAADFLRHIERRRRRPEEVRRTLQQELLPALGDRPIVSITPRDIRRVVEGVVARGAPTQAGKVLAHAKQLFRFACGRDELAVAANPAFPLEAEALGVENRICQRFLSAEEIPLFLAALQAARLTPTVKLGLRVILLTGVRTCELLRARWADVDLAAGKWVVPVSSQKLSRRQEQTARPWRVPLSPAAVDLFKQLQVLAQGSEWVMASPWNPLKVLTQKALVAGMRKLFEAGKGRQPLLDLPGERPTPHDLRRTVRTHLEETLGVDESVAERCLNHSRGPIVKIYAVGDYLEQRRAALERWANYVEALQGSSARFEILRAKGR